jgi:hypothetical protein
VRLAHLRADTLTALVTSQADGAAA